jgi:hypothetical protein
MSAASAQTLAFAGLAAAAQSVPIAEFAAKVQSWTIAEVAARNQSLEVSAHAADIAPRTQFCPTQAILPHAAEIGATNAANDSPDRAAAGAGGVPAARGREITTGIVSRTAAHRTGAITLLGGITAKSAASTAHCNGVREITTSFASSQCLRACSQRPKFGNRGVRSLGPDFGLRGACSRNPECTNRRVCSPISELENRRGRCQRPEFGGIDPRSQY